MLGFFLPVYAEHHSGVSWIASLDGGTLVLGATGGYLSGSSSAAGVVGRLAELGWDRHMAGALGGDGDRQRDHLHLRRPVADGRDRDEPLRPPSTPGSCRSSITDLIKLVLAAGVFPLAWWVVGRRPGER